MQQNSITCGHRAENASNCGPNHHVLMHFRLRPAAQQPAHRGHPLVPAAGAAPPVCLCAGRPAVEGRAAAPALLAAHSLPCRRPSLALQVGAAQRRAAAGGGAVRQLQPRRRHHLRQRSVTSYIVQENLCRCVCKCLDKAQSIRARCAAVAAPSVAIPPLGILSI